MNNLVKRGTPEYESAMRQARVDTSSTVKDYKAEFENILLGAQIRFEKEYKFKEDRKWQFDYKIGEKIAVEYEGGVETNQPGHAWKQGILRDIEKYNEAALDGFVVIRIYASTVKSGLAFKLVQRAIKKENALRNKRDCASISDKENVLHDTRQTLKSLLGRIEAATTE